MITPFEDIWYALRYAHTWLRRPPTPAVVSRPLQCKDRVELWQWVLSNCPRSLDDILEGDRLRLTVTHNLKAEQKNMVNMGARETIAQARGMIMSEEAPARVYELKLADKGERVLYKLTWG